MATKILFIPKQPDAILDMARKLTPPGFELVVVDQDTPEFYEAVKDAEYVMGLGRPIAGEFFRSAPKLKLVQLLSAGYDRVDIESARKAKVPVANNGGANAIAVSEHAIMLMLAVLKRLVVFHNDVVAGKWRVGNHLDSRVFELHGKTLGIVGLGNIGKKVARLAHAFNMNVLYYDVARLTEDQEDALGVRFVLFTELSAGGGHRQPARAARREHAQSHRRARAGDDEEDRDPHQHLPRAGRGRGGASQGADGRTRSWPPGSTCWSRSRRRPIIRSMR